MGDTIVNKILNFGDPKDSTLKVFLYENYLMVENINKEYTLQITKLQSEKKSLQKELNGKESLIENLVENLKLITLISNERFLISSKNFSFYKNFKFKAQKHIYYLEIIMIIFMAILYEFQYLSQLQSAIVIFIILFNIAFTQNMLNNLFLSNNNNQSIIDNKKKLDDIEKYPEYVFDCL